MINGIKTALNKEMKFAWEGGFSIRVRSVSRRDTLALASEGTERLPGRKQKDGSFKTVEYLNKLFNFALIGWDGLTYQTLSTIVEGYDFSGQKQDEVLEFSDENKAFVLENMNNEFSGFLSASIDQAEKLGTAHLGN